MADREEHDGHSEPSIASHAIGVWLFALPAAGIAAYYWRDYALLIGLLCLTWLPVCFSVSSSLTCRNANRMSRSDHRKSLALAGLPYAPLVVGFIYTLNTIS
jgi:hypothetical protein